MTDTAVFAVGRLPTVVVDVDGQPLEPRQTAGLVEIVVRQALAAPTLCELVFAEPPGTLDVVDTLVPGADLTVSLVGSDTHLFQGDVVAVEHAYGAAHARELRVRGYDRMHRLRKQQTVRVLENVTPEDVARELGGTIGLSVEAAETGPTWDRLVQHTHTDLRLLLEVTSRAGLYPTLRDTTLHLVTLEGLDEPVALHWGTSLIEVRVEANGERAADSVEASGWDMSRVETWSATATTARSGRDIATSIAAADVGGSGERMLTDESLPDQERAAALAQADLDVRVASEVTLRGVAMGDARLRPATPIEIDNLGSQFSGRYIVTEAVHRISRAEGYLTEISTGPPHTPDRPRETVAVLGVVTSVEDPDQLGRIQVSLPTIGDISSAWMEVISVGAGSGKGLVALPDVDDKVLVVFLHGDPAHGIVLGGLYGAEGPPDSGVVGGAIKRYTLLTSGGHKVQLDDENGDLVITDSSDGKVTMGNQKLRIEDATGTSLEMTQQQVTLHSAVPLTIEAPGNSVVIKGSSIDFETA